jgi:putative aminopeptidase FrvX
VRFTGVGGWDPRGLLAQPVVVHGRTPLPGVIGARPPHVLPPNELDKVLPMEELFIDLGRPADEVAQLVRVGDVVTMRRSTHQLAGTRWAGKAMDNRASVAAIAIALETLHGLRHAWDVYAVATVQEEVGLKGAATAAYGLAPAVAIAVDVGFAKQPGAGDLPYSLDGGPQIALGPNIHPRVYEALVATADRLEMAYQVEPLPGPTGTDAGAMQVAAAGIPCGLVGIPLRYMHSTVETVSLKDIERAGRLLAHFVAALDADFVAGLVEDAGDWDTVPGAHTA